MGCDINGVLQKREPNTNEWTTFAPIERFFDGRSYKLFGILAGVRDQDVEVISDQRGFPEGFECTYSNEHSHKPWPAYYPTSQGLLPLDAYIVRETWMGEHNFGWVTFREFLDYNWNQEAEDHEGNLCHLGVMFSWLHKDVYKICSDEKAHPSGIRMVFGFDS